MNKEEIRIFGTIAEDDVAIFHWFGKDQNWWDDFYPASDYEIDPTPSQDVEFELADILYNHEQILDELGFEGIRWSYVCLYNEELARFINGTHNYPFIVLDSIQLLKSTSNSDQTLDEVIEETLLHEYAHAWFESWGLELEDEEVKAEQFATLLSNERDIKSAMKFLHSLIEK